MPHQARPRVQWHRSICGARPGALSDYEECARRLATALVAREISLVYGGASVGLMGVLQTRACASGRVTVSCQELLFLEADHPGLVDLRLVDGMHERKALMSDLADAFITCPRLVH